MNLCVVSVVDSFAISANLVAVNHALGVVVIFDGRQCGFQIPELPAAFEILRPDGTVLKAQASESKEHGEGRSLFFEGLTREQAPVGSVIYWTPKTARELVSANAMQS